MAVERASTTPQHPQLPVQLTAAEIIDRLSRFDGPPEQFLIRMLAVQCQLASASSGAILRPGQQGQPEPIAVYPPVPQGQTTPMWLAQATEQAAEVASGGGTVVRPVHESHELYGAPAKRHLVFVPLMGSAGVRGVAAYVLETADRTGLATAVERLELTVSLLSLYEMRLTLQRRQGDLQRLGTAVNTLTSVNDQDRFAAAGMAFCNELAAHFHADRVSFGVLKSRYVHVKASSHTEKFSRKMRIIQDIESAMEECLDQDVEIVHPCGEQAPYVSRAAAHLSAEHGHNTILSLPLRRQGQPVGALTLERPQDRYFTIEEVESLRLLADLASPRLLGLYQQDRWFGARLALSARKGLATFVGSKHTWIKIAAIAIVAAIVFLTFAKGTYKVEAPFVVQASSRQIIPAPFDGFLKTVKVEPSDKVIAGQTVLATMDTADLQLQLASAKAERISHEKEADVAVREGKPGEQQVALAAADRVQAQIKLLEHKIAQATIVAPIDGTVTRGELKRQLGSPVQVGSVLFEIAPLRDLEAELHVKESDISDLLTYQGQLAGELATKTWPDRKTSFNVERISPIAELVNQANVFKVTAHFTTEPPDLRAGMEGVAKVEIGQRRYIWIWTRKLVNWVRMQLWW